MGDDESGGEGSVSMDRVRTRARMAAWMATDSLD